MKAFCQRQKLSQSKLPSFSNFALARQEIHLWSIRLQPARDIEVLLAALSHDELEREGKYRFEKHARRFVQSRYFLHAALAHYLDVSPREVQFEVGAHGKPQLHHSLKRNCNLHFNLSHSDSLVLCALSADEPIGVDIEAIHPDFDFEAMMSICLIDEESNDVQAAPAHLRHQVFLEYWTCKEAVLKALGCGLSKPMTEVFVEFNDAPEAPSGTGDGLNLTLLKNFNELGHVAAIAHSIQNPKIEWRQFEFYDTKKSVRG